ncbi:hypothetical protein [Ruminococcus sp.]|uniref:hypothetical protein n=1 Tax=Ruminococcus sp. TaxID=41978 RepID=UPI0025D501C0|nr:hypothetical protein [Ruminococcus sp.]
MPKQIKAEKMKKSERSYRKWACAGLFGSVAFMGALGGLINYIIKTEKVLPTAIVFGLFIVYAFLCVMCAVKGIMGYVNDDIGVCLGQGIINVFCSVACIMNFRMALIMLLAACKADNAVSNLIGSQTQTEFVQSQYASWIFLAFATLVSIILGILAMVKLSKNKE